MNASAPAAVTKIAISLPPELLARVDGEAAARGKNRSAFIRETLESALAVVEEERAVREARAVYAAIEEDPAFWAAHEAFAVVASETVPPFRQPAEPSPSRSTYRRPKKAQQATGRR